MANIVTEAVGTAIPDATLKGYLVEIGRANYAQHSEDLNVYWLIPVSQCTIGTNSAIAPSGMMTADKIQEDATNNVHYVARNNSGLSTPSTFSAYVKSAERTKVFAYMHTGSTALVYYDIQNGTVLSVTGTASPTASITHVGNSWYRISITASISAGYAGLGLVIQDGNLVYQGITGYGVYVWGMQLEAGSFASSYIPTLFSAVTRGLDSNRETVSGNILTTILTGYLEFTPSAISNPAYLFGSYVDVNNGTYVLFDGTNLLFRKRISGTNYDATIAYTPVAGTRIKLAWRLDTITGMDIFLNGTKGTNNNNTTAMQLGTYFYIGTDGNATYSASGDIRNNKVWKVAKSDTYLKAITA
jgi:hypothetical protein